MSCTCNFLSTATRRAAAMASSARQLSTTVQRRAPAAAKQAPSSCPAGTKLTGLNYLKDGSDPVAKDDAEYPSWLWGILETRKFGDDREGDLARERRKMKQDSKTAIKASNTLKG